MALPADAGAPAPQELDMSLDEVESIINDLFKKYDQEPFQTAQMHEHDISLMHLINV